MNMPVVEKTTLMMGLSGHSMTSQEEEVRRQAEEAFPSWSNIEGYCIDDRSDANASNAFSDNNNDEL